MDRDGSSISESKKRKRAPSLDEIEEDAEDLNPKAKQRIKRAVDPYAPIFVSKEDAHHLLYDEDVLGGGETEVSNSISTPSPAGTDDIGSLWAHVYSFILKGQEDAGRRPIQPLLFALLYTRFVLEAQQIAAILIREQTLPISKRTYKPARSGMMTNGEAGVAGGAKYIINGIFFKFPRTLNRLYANEEEAMKAMSLEINAIKQVQKCAIPGLFVPLSVCIDFMGYRVLAACHLPLRGRSASSVPLNTSSGSIPPLPTQVYGAAQGGRGGFIFDPSIDAKLALLARQLNIAPHVAFGRTIHAPWDLEVHRVRDLLFLVDLHRMFPAEPVALPLTPAESASNAADYDVLSTTSPAGSGSGADRGLLFRQLRHEYVRTLPFPANPDAFFPLGSSPESEDQIRHATRQLRHDVVPRLAGELVGKFGTPLPSNQHVLPGLVGRVHEAGVNLRYLGWLRHHVLRLVGGDPGHPAAQFLLVEMVLRAAIKWLERELRANKQLEPSVRLANAARWLDRVLLAEADDGDTTPDPTPDVDMTNAGKWWQNDIKTLLRTKYEEWLAGPTLGGNAADWSARWSGLAATEAPSSYDLRRSLPARWRDITIARVNEISCFHVQSASGTSGPRLSVDWRFKLKYMSNLSLSDEARRAAAAYLDRLAGEHVGLRALIEEVKMSLSPVVDVATPSASAALSASSGPAPAPVLRNNVLLPLQSVPPAELDFEKSFGKFQGKVPREEIARRIAVLLKEKSAYLALRPNAVDLYASPEGSEVDFSLNFASEGAAAAASGTRTQPWTAWNVRSQKQPLLGVRVAIDPCLIGQAFAPYEQHTFPLPGNGGVIDAGVENLRLAEKLRDRLVALGAEVLLVRERAGEGLYLKNPLQLASISAATVELLFIYSNLLPVPPAYLFTQWRAALEALENPSTRGELSAEFFRRCVVLPLEMVLRAKRANMFSPHACLSLYLGIDTFPGDRQRPGAGNYFLYIPGAFHPSELMTRESRHDFVRLLTAPTVPRSVEFAEVLAGVFTERAGELGLRGTPRGNEPPNVQKNTIRANTAANDDAPIFHRNLSMVRRVHGGAVCYAEMYDLSTGSPDAPALAGRMDALADAFTEAVRRYVADKGALLGIQRMPLPFTRELFLVGGQQGNDVVILQALLERPVPDIELIDSDKRFTEGTKKALVRFQLEHGLEPTGVLNAMTAQRLLDRHLADGYHDPQTGVLPPLYRYKIYIPVRRDRMQELEGVLYDRFHNPLWRFPAKTAGQSDCVASGRPLLNELTTFGATPTGLYEVDLNTPMPEVEHARFGALPFNRAVTGLAGNAHVALTYGIRSGILMHTGYWEGWSEESGMPMPVSHGCIHIRPSDAAKIVEILETKLGVAQHENTMGEILPYPHTPQGLLSIELVE